MYFLKAKEEAGKLGYLYYESEILKGLGELEYDQGNIANTLEIYEEGIALAERVGNSHLASQFYHGMGKCYHDLEELAKSARYYKKAIHEIESIRKGIGLEGHRSSFMAGALDIYRDMIDLQISMGNEEIAYEFYEKMKARNLLDILDGAFLVFEDEMSLEEIEKERLMEDRLRKVNSEIRGFTYNSGTTRSLDSLSRQLRVARRKLDRFKSSLFFNHPELKRKMGEGEPLRTRQAIKLLNLNELQNIKKILHLHII